MKLSEAMRIGAACHPQGTGLMFKMENGQLRTCALGAAYEGWFGCQEAEPDNTYSTLYEVFPLLRENSERLAQQIWQMNDQYGKTREEIADWLQEQGL